MLGAGRRAPCPHRRRCEDHSMYASVSVASGGQSGSWSTHCIPRRRVGHPASLCAHVPFGPDACATCGVLGTLTVPRLCLRQVEQRSGKRCKRLISLELCGCVRAYEPRGRGFESCQPHHLFSASDRRLGRVCVWAVSSACGTLPWSRSLRSACASRAEMNVSRVSSCTWRRGDSRDRSLIVGPSHSRPGWHSSSKRGRPLWTPRADRMQ